MQAKQAWLLATLKNATQFAVPIYQRTYSWGERECRQLWDDILRTGADPAATSHFVGSLVYIESGGPIADPVPNVVIDGQQRITTICLLLEALARRVGDEEPVEGFSQAKLRQYYLLNPLEKDERMFKLILTQQDKETLIALLRQIDLPQDHSLRIEQNFSLFEELIAKCGDDLSSLCRGLEKLMIVDVALERGRDNPQLIFESMNSTGKELSQADLIRNYILMGLERDHQRNLYEDHWRPMEREFGQEAYGSQFDTFMRHFLTIKNREMPNKDAVYEAFKAYSRSPKIEASSVDDLVKDVRTYASFYCAMALGKETDPQLSRAFRDLRELKVEVSYPFLLEVYGNYRDNLISTDDFVEIIRLVESYVFRRAVCGIPTSSLNKTFATIHRSLDVNAYVESLKAFLILLPSYRRFPTDDEFQRDMTLRDLYNFRSRSYWLRRMENFGRKELVNVDEYTIEHVMPQRDDLTPEWRADLGPEWERIHETKLHTLGNLTLTGYNSELGSKSFTVKRDMPGGFKESPILLNKSLAKLDQWNEAAIDARAEELAKKATEVWVSPSLDSETLERYQPQAKKADSLYTLADHPHLAPGSHWRVLFDALRAEILNLDPVVTEEILKLYIAYKAETNFIDVVPQANRLRLTLNMKFHELTDPDGKAKDVTGLGQWGNGDVQVGLTELEQLPYIMGLIRQSFEMQMGSGEDVL